MGKRSQRRKSELDAEQPTSSRRQSPSPVVTHPRQDVKPPPFWPNNPSLWFVKVEALFDSAGVTSQRAKFNSLTQGLADDHMVKVAPVLENPVIGSEYDDLKSALLKSFGKTQGQKDSELFSMKGLGDETARDFVVRLEGLVTDVEQMKKAFLLLQLPDEVKSIVSSHQFETCKELADIVDRVLDSRCLKQVGVCAAEVNAFSKSRKTQKKKTDIADDPDSTTCFYHLKYGPKAKKCRPGCIWAPVFSPPSGNAPNPM